MTSVLIVDAGQDGLHAECELLESQGYDVIEIVGALDGLRTLYEQRPEAVLVNLAVPAMDGDEFTKIVRALSDVPIVAIGPGDDPDLVVRVLDGGADDYLELPVSELILLGRLRAALRRAERHRSAEDRPAVVRTGDLVIELAEQAVYKRGEVVSLTPTEYRMLAALASRLGKVAPHRFLLSTVWGEEYMDDTHYLRIYVGYLRKKIEDEPSDPRYLLSQWGTGYRLADLPPVEPPMLKAAGLEANGEIARGAYTAPPDS